ncbi:MAG: TonB-dependent receptor [Sphingobacteriaceae bacterium]|nr:MAG: TonB-dependent receptor [Sphingobacteriaceae bacterium]
MKQKLLIFFLFGLFALQSALAQTRKITGTVTGSDDRLPLPGVSVQVTGTRTGSQTNAQGSYTVTVPIDAKSLTFTYIGYSSKTVQLGNQTTINLTLTSDNKALSEVVVTGYGITQKKSEIGGAISTINGSEFANQPIASLQTALQGRAAGVVVTANNGIPGGAINVRIRGVGSFSGSTQPLYVVDGVQLSGDSFGGFTQSNSLAGINSSDIESIEVLKDAASTSIYGSSGANGVIIITTKKGKAGKTKLNFNYYTGRSSTIKTFDVLNTQEYIQMRTEAYQNANPLVAATAIRNAVLGEIGQPTTLNNEQVAALPTYDWQKQAFHTGLVSDYELSANGGSDKTTFYVSGAYNIQSAVITKSDFRRGTFKVNLDHKVNDKLSFNGNINLSTFTQKAPFAISGSFLGSPAFSSSLILPSNPIYNADGTYYGLQGSGQTFYGILNNNIVATNEYNKSNQATNQLIGSFSANYNILPALQFRSFYSMDYRTIDGQNYSDPRTNDAYSIKGSKNAFNDNRANILTDQILSYNKTFNEDHKVSALVAFEYRQQQSHQIGAYATGLPPGYTNLSAAAVPTTTYESYTGFKTLSYFTKEQYTYKNKYSLGASIRYQGSSRFGSNNQFGWFPGLSLAWTFSQENFLKDVSWIEDLKFRASTGSAGNDNPIGNFDARSLFSAGYIYAGSPGEAPVSLANPNLKWEKSTDYNLGIDYSLFKNRISGSFGVYLKRSTNLLLAQPVISTSGYGSVTTNVGAMDNKGIEAEITTVNFQTKGGFRWSSDFNFSVNQNTVKKLYNDLQILPSNLSVRVGWDYGSIYTYKYAGVNPATGRSMWYDGNGNTTYAVNASTDRYNIGTTLPKFTGGFTNTFSYKGFDLNVLLQYQYGQKAYDSQIAFLYEDGRRSFNTLQSVYDSRWTTPGQLTDISRPYNGGSEAQSSAATTASSFLYFKTDYIRMKEAQVGYTVPAKLLSRIKINSLRVYAQATNLFTITKFPGYDPEYYDTTNNNAGAIPTSKNVTFGVQLGL